jgi:hypothetical protein
MHDRVGLNEIIKFHIIHLTALKEHDWGVSAPFLPLFVIKRQAYANPISDEHASRHVA